MEDDDIITVEHEGKKTGVNVFDIIDPNQPRVSKNIRNDRLSICKQCERYSMGRCLECGCFMKLKTTLANASCPLHKWTQNE